MTTKKYISDYPDLMEEWDWERNSELDPTTITHSSAKFKPFWVCPKNHSYQSEAYRRTRGRGCNICSGKAIVIGVNNISHTHPEVAKYLLNPSDGDKYSQGNTTKVPWKCELGHITHARISHRVSGTGCRICTNQEVLVGFNDLWTTDPDFAVQLLDQTDGYKYVVHTAKRLFWLCSKGHIYNISVSSRKRSGSGCPTCSYRISKPELTLLMLIPNSDGQYKYIHEGNTFTPDVYSHEHDMFIEYDGAKWHSDRVEEDLNKTKILLDNGHKVVRLRETFNKSYPLGLLPLSHENLLQIPVKYHREMKHIEPAWIQIQEWLSK